MSGIFSVLLFLFFTTVTSFNYELLDPPHSVSGYVWEDWNEDGIRQSSEPGFPYVKVSLIYQSTEETNLILDSTEPYSSVIKEYWTLNDGYYHFDCLASGSYAVSFQVPENRPSNFSTANFGTRNTVDSDVTSISADGRVGTTDFFLAESDGSSSIDCGLYQYMFVSLFSMTGRESVPTAPNTILGSTYTVYDARVSTLYYRIEHDPWKNENEGERTGFHKGFPGENGDRVRSLGDRSTIKTNYWVVPEDVKPFLFSGSLYMYSFSTGSFTDLGRIRGNWYNFYNKKYVKTSVHLSGQNIVPDPVLTQAYGTVDVDFNIDAPYFTYSVSLTDLGRASVYNIGVYGPADINSQGNFLFQLSEEGGQYDISEFPDFVDNFLSGSLFILVTTSEFPSGHLRGQITNFSPAVYTSIFDLKSTSSAFGQAAFTLDTVKHHLTYYVYFEGLSSPESFTALFTPEGFETLEGQYTTGTSAIKNGFFWETSPDLERELLAGQVTIEVSTDEGPELTGTLGNWF